MLDRKLHATIFYFSLLLAAFTMPLHKLANSISIIILVLNWLAEGNFRDKFKSFRQHALLIAFLLFYFLHVIGMFYTENRDEGFFNLQKKLALLVLPIVLGTTAAINKQQLHNVLKTFVISCLLASLICLCYGLYNYFFRHDSAFLFYSGLSSVIDIHAPYFAMYLCFCLFIAIYFLAMHYNRFSWYYQIGFVFLILYFITFIILLSARTTLAAMIAILLVGGAYLSFIKKKPALGILLLIFVMASIFFSITSVPFLKERFTQLLHSDLNAPPNGENANGLTIRIIKWKCSAEGIKDYPLAGVGTGDAQDYLTLCYEKENFWGMYPQYRYNSHNQFLQTGLTIGLSGLLLLLACMVLPVVQSLKRKDYLFLSFLTLFFICCLTESLLERQNGVVFFAFFNSLYALNGFRQNHSYT